MNDWRIFHGDPRKPHSETERLQSNVPPWRDFKTSKSHRGKTYIPSDQEIQVVNAALYLRRPVLVTGPPGSGKSSLAYAVAEELQLGPVLKWPINSRSSLLEGLYSYDAIARLRDANLKGEQGCSSDITRYIKLQWLGTALSSATPRVLLIDEIDKADVDLPNDLLHVLEEGSFVIDELARLAEEEPQHELRTIEADLPDAPTRRITVPGGLITCQTFPIIIMTSNGERELPPAFHRRCLRLEMQEPNAKRLKQIVLSHLEEVLQQHGYKPTEDEAEDAEQQDDGKDPLTALIHDFINLRREGRVMANDQLLNLAFLLLAQQNPPEGEQREAVKKLLFRGLDQ
jgi:MoxR-like ATPase